MNNEPNFGDRWPRRHIAAGRGLLMLAILALVGAWVTQVTDRTLLGMSQQHLYNDSTVLALLGIGAFLDAFWHSKNK